MKFIRAKKPRIYLDFAAATPLRARVYEKMKPYLKTHFANASAIHGEGVAMRLVIDEARERIARTVKARPEHVYFTGSGTESNNLAILGAINALHRSGKAYAEMEVIATAVEHPSVTNTVEHLKELGVVVLIVPVDASGAIDVEALKGLLSEKTVLVTFAYINSEIGVVQEVGKISRVVRAYERDHDQRIYVHTDAAQAPLWVSCELDRLMVDMFSLDAGKCYGPKGVGVLVARHGVELAPVLYGGPQEAGVRPATENTAGIIGAAEAIVLAQNAFQARAQKVQSVRDFMITSLLSIEGAVLNGAHGMRAANNVNISIPGIDSEFAVVVLDEAGVACSTKSACSGAGGGGSAVVRAISGDEARATSSIRFTLGEETTRREVTKAVEILRSHVEKNRLATSRLTQ